MNILILLSFLVEVGILVYFEKKIWNTLYTPLNFLLLPYTLILIITILVSGHLGFVEFYYPSILLGTVGAFIFFIPSLLLGISYRKKYGIPQSTVEEFSFSKPLMILTQLLIVLFAIHFYQVYRSSIFIPGSDEFAEEFCEKGIWAHLWVILMPLLMLFVYSVDKKHKIYWMYIVCLLFFIVMNQVKGWVIIPCVAGVSLRLYTKKMKLKFSLILKIFLIGFLFFQLSYILIMVVAGESELNMNFIEEMSAHFFHYLTSGTFGLSMDAEMGFPDRREIEYILVPFFNLVNVFTGEELLSPINPLFLVPGVSGTNVRTFFGTAFINTTWYQFVIYILSLSFITYFLKIISQLTQNVMINMIYMYYCALLCMGWFEFYFFHLDVIEIPLFFFIFIVLQKIRLTFRKNDSLIINE